MYFINKQRWGRGEGNRKRSREQEKVIMCKACSRQVNEYFWRAYYVGGAPFKWKECDKGLVQSQAILLVLIFTPYRNYWMYQMLSLIALIYSIMTATRWSKNHNCSQIIQEETEMLTVQWLAQVHAARASRSRDSRVPVRPWSLCSWPWPNHCQFSPEVQCVACLLSCPSRKWAAWGQGRGSLLSVPLIPHSVNVAWARSMSVGHKRFAMEALRREWAHLLGLEG